MTPRQTHRLLKLLYGLVALSLAWLCAEVFRAPHLFTATSQRLLIHLLVGLLLAISLVLLAVLSHRARKSQDDLYLQALKEMEQAMTKAARRYRALLEGAGNAIFVFDAENNALQEINRKAVELFGYSKEEMIRLRGLDLVPASDQEKFTALVLRVKRRGRARSSGLLLKRRDGRLLLGEVDARLIELGDEKVIHVIVRDITLRTQARKELQQRNQELTLLNTILLKASESRQLPTVLEVALRESRELFAAEGGVIHLMEADGRTLRLTAAQHVSTGLREELARSDLQTEFQCQFAASQHCHALTDLAHSPCRIAALAARDGWQCVTAVPLLTKNALIGIMHLLSREFCPHTEDEIRFLSTLGTQTGIVIEHARLFTELNRKTDELERSHALLEESSARLARSEKQLKENLALVEKANLELGRLDRMKGHFLGMISHEFKTPLTSILGSAELLLASRDSMRDEELCQLLEMVREGGLRLDEIVSDLLKVARLEARNEPVNGTPLFLADIAAVTLQQLEPYLAERRQRVNLVGLEALPYFTGDREYLADIFSELLGNAMKFTLDGGEISVVGQLTNRQLLSGLTSVLARFNRRFPEQMGDAHYLLIEVRDSGIGIDAAEQEAIFEKFYEVGDIHHHFSSKYKFQGKGAGLGLAIVRGMIEAHGGMVWVESRTSQAPAAGSRFSLLLPLEPPQRQPHLPFLRSDGEPSATLPTDADRTGE